MAGATTTVTQDPNLGDRFQDSPPTDDLQNWIVLYNSAAPMTLSVHFSGSHATTVAYRIRVGPSPSDVDDIRMPDPLVAFDFSTGS